MFVHTVFFWLNANVSAESEAALVRDCRDLLGKCPTVKHIWTGVPAMTPRDVVDNTYAVGLTTVFDDRKGHDDYQVHPLHKQFIDRNKQHWARVQVYDFIG